MNLTPELIDRALQIADESMAALVRGHGIPADETYSRYLLANEFQSEVEKLEKADPALVEAFEYLRDRGLATLEAEGGTEIIQLSFDI